MIQRLAYVIFTVAILTGLAAILSVYWRPTIPGLDSLPEPQQSRTRQKRLARGFYTLVCATSGLAFLSLGVASAFEMLFGATVVRALFEVGIRNWRPRISSRPSCIVRDAE